MINYDLYYQSLYRKEITEQAADMLIKQITRIFDPHRYRAMYPTYASEYFKWASGMGEAR
jgi:hypothetical protein